MKIAFVIPYIITWGGPAQVIRDVSRMLVADGHYAKIFSTDVGAVGEKVNPSGVLDGVDVHTFRNASRWLARHRGAYFPPRFATAFADEVASFDAVHIAEYRHVLGVWAARSAARRGVPVVLAPHGSLLNALQRTRLKGAFDGLFGRRLLGRVDQFQAVTRAEAMVLADAGIPADRISVIPNGVELPMLPSSDEREQARVSLGLTPVDFTLLFMARLHPNKGLMQLLAVLEHLRRQGVGAKLLIAGADDGDQENAGRFLAEHGLGDAVRLLGFVSGAAKRRAMVASDLFVSLSTYETMPVAVLEALSYGLAGVVSAPAAVEGIESSKAGVIVSLSDVPGIVKVLRDLAVSPNRRAAMGEAGRALVSREYSLARVVPRYVEMYSRLAG